MLYHILAKDYLSLERVSYNSSNLKTLHLLLVLEIFLREYRVS